MGTKGRHPDALIARRSATAEAERPEASSAPCAAMAARIVEPSAAVHAAEGALVTLLAEFHEAKGWNGSGYRSLEHWLTVNAGFTLAERRRRRAPVDADTAGSDDGETGDETGGGDGGDGRGPLTWWRHWWDDHGYLVVDGRLDPTGGAELVAAVDAMGPPPGAAPCSRATAGAPSRVATTVVSSTPTTSAPGSREAARTSTTWCSCAAATTGSCTPGST